MNANTKLLCVCDMDMAGDEIWKVGMHKVCAKWCGNTSLKAVISILLGVKEELVLIFES